MRNIINIARVFSTLFRPVYYPTVCFLLIFLLIVPWEAWGLPYSLSTSFGTLNISCFTLFMLATVVVFIFTVLMPVFGVYLYRRIKDITPIQLRIREHRFIPYLINILCYMLCLQCLVHLGIPDTFWCIIISALMLQFACIIMNFFHKVSMHAAGAAGIVGAIIGYTQMAAFDPLWWVCISVLLWGCVASSRLILRAHTLGQILTGSLIGLVCGFYGIIYTTILIHYSMG